MPLWYLVSVCTFSENCHFGLHLQHTWLWLRYIYKFIILTHRYIDLLNSSVTVVSYRAREIELDPNILIDSPKVSCSILKHFWNHAIFLLPFFEKVLYDLSFNKWLVFVKVEEHMKSSLENFVFSTSWYILLGLFFEFLGRWCKKMFEQHNHHKEM